MNLKLFTSLVTRHLVMAVIAMLAISAAAGDDLVTRTFKVPPDFLKASGLPGKPTAMDVLKAQRIVFPEGASAIYFPPRSTLTVTNTQGNMNAVEAYVNRITGFAPQGKPVPRIPMDINIAVQGYELPRKDAAVILQSLDVKIESGALIQQAAKAHAKIIKLGTVKAASGARAAANERDCRIEVDPILGPDGRTVDVVLAIDQGVRKLFTTVTVVDGGISFLGTTEEAGKDSVEFLFLRATLSRSAP